MENVYHDPEYLRALADDQHAAFENREGHPCQVKGSFRGFHSCGRSHYRNTARSAIMFFRAWDKSGRPAYISKRMAARAIGVDLANFSHALSRGKRWAKYLTVHNSEIYAPSLIEQIRWIPLSEAAKYIGIPEDTIHNYIKGDRSILVMWRDFRGCVCVDMTWMFAIAAWRHVNRVLNRRFKQTLIGSFSRLSYDAVVDVMQTVGRHDGTR